MSSPLPQPPSPPSPPMAHPPRRLRQTLLQSRCLRHQAHLSSPRSSVRRPSRLHANLTLHHGNPRRHPPQTIRLISNNNYATPPLLALFPRQTLRRTVSVAVPSLFSALFPRKNHRRHSCHPRHSHHTPISFPRTKTTIIWTPPSLLPCCPPTCCTIAVPLVRLRNIPMLYPFTAPLPLTEIIRRPLAHPLACHHPNQHRTCVPTSQRVWIGPASPRTAFHSLAALAYMARRHTTRRGSTPSSRSHAARTSHIVHQSRPFSMPPTLTRSTSRHLRCRPCHLSLLRQPVPWRSMSSSSRMRSHGTTQIRSAPALPRWRSRQTRGIRSVCRLLFRRQVWHQPAATSFPSASPLWLPRRSTRNIPLPWRVAYTDARLGPSSRFTARRATRARRLALGVALVRTFQTSPARAATLMKMAGECRVYQRVRC